MFSLQSRISFAILLLPLIDSVIAVYPEKWCLSAEAKSGLWDNKMYVVGGYLDDVSDKEYRANTEVTILDFTRPSADFQTDLSLIKTIRIPNGNPDSIMKWGSAYAHDSKLYIAHGDPVQQRKYNFGNSSFYSPGKAGKLKGRVQVYDMKTSKWTIQPPSKQVPDSASCAGSGFSKELGKSFVLAGRLEEQLIRNPKMVVHDAANNLWQNITVPSYLTGIEFAEVVPITGSNLGTDGGGVLVVFGGVTMSPGEKMTVNDYKRIYIYDINGDKWYIQPAQSITGASGTVPTIRTHTCSVVASAPDGSSHNIFLYGGHSPTNVDGSLKVYGEVWVLSIPSFTWQLVSNQGLERYDQTCQLVDDRYLVSWGGRKNFHKGECTAPDSPLNVQLFDLNTLRWTTKYEKTEEGYKVAAEISDYLGGDQNGTAKVQAPPQGYQNPDLALLFPKVEKSIIPTTPPSTKPETPDPSTPVSSSSDSSEKKLPLGAIVGGVVGGLGAFALGLALFFFIRRHKQSNLDSASKVELAGDETERPSELEHYSKTVPGAMSELDGDTIRPSELEGTVRSASPEAVRFEAGSGEVKGYR